MTVNRLRKQNTLVIATKRCLKELGKDIIVIEAEKEMEIDKIRIRGIKAYNSEKGNKAKVAHKKGIGVGYVINIKGKSIYHAGDTDLIPEMDHIGKVDIALLPIGDRDFTMDLSEAVEATIRIKPKVVIPMHRFEADPEEFKKQVEYKSDIIVAPLKIGEVYRL